MRPFRRNSLTEKLIGVVSQLLIFGFSALFCLWMISGARAGEIAELISIRSESSLQNRVQIEMEFSRELQADQISATFERDFFQLAIDRSSVFPAKSEKLQNEWVRKAFSYQYQPGLTRTRLYLGAKANQFKNALSWEVKEKKLVVRFDAEKIAHLPTEVKQATATEKPLKVAQDTVPTQAAAVSRSDLTKEEEVLLRSMSERLEAKQSKPTTDSIVKPAEVKTPSQNESRVAADVKAESDLFSGMRRESTRSSVESGHSPGLGVGKVVFSLAFVLVIILGVGVGFRKLVLKKGFSLGGANNLIKPLTSYTLAPGKQITIVRIGDEVLVLGVTSANISLITTLNVDPDLDAKSGMNTPKEKRSTFNQLLEEHLAGQEEVPKSATMSTAAGRLVEKAFQSLGVREAIKDRVRGFKQLS